MSRLTREDKAECARVLMADGSPLSCFTALRYMERHGVDLAEAGIDGEVFRGMEVLAHMYPAKLALRNARKHPSIEMVMRVRDLVEKHQISLDLLGTSNDELNELAMNASREHLRRDAEVDALFI